MRLPRTSQEVPKTWAQVGAGRPVGQVSGKVVGGGSARARASAREMRSMGRLMVRGVISINMMREIYIYILMRLDLRSFVWLVNVWSWGCIPRDGNSVRKRCDL